MILTVRVDQRITIGPDVVVTVLSVGPRAVRLGCDAPREVQIDREEIHARKLAARRTARYGPGWRGGGGGSGSGEG